MRRLISYLVVLAANAAAQDAPSGGQAVEGQPVPEPAPAETRVKTESSSRQFVIHGSDFAMRSAIATLAEETRGELLSEVGDDGPWEHSIAIQLHGKNGDPVPARTMRTQFFQVPGGFRLQLDIHLAKGKPRDLDRALLELLLIERGLRGLGPERLEAALSIPPWLLDGLVESFLWRRGDRDRDLYAALFEKNQLFPVKKLLEVENPAEMDSMSRAAFRASTGALVMALLNQTGGKKAMVAMLKDVATFEGDEMALLLKHFPGMNLGEASFAKWWALQLARLSDTPFLQVLDIRETERELQRLLVVRFKDAGGADLAIPADQFRDLLALPLEKRRKAIGPVAERCGVLLYRAFPAHRPILVEYLRILGEIAHDTDNSVGERLESLAGQRTHLLAVGLRVRDYLEWYRITNAKQLSGDFESFIELKENLQSPPTRRKGPIAEYLDDMQRIYEDK